MFKYSFYVTKYKVSPIILWLFHYGFWNEYESTNQNSDVLTLCYIEILNTNEILPDIMR